MSQEKLFKRCFNTTMGPLLLLLLLLAYAAHPSAVVTATSVTDPSKSASATLTVTGPGRISMAFSLAPPGSMAVGTTANVAATVTNDPANRGVDWTVACASAACGSFNPAHTASGTQTVYTPPANIPRLNTVIIIATSTADPTVSRSAIVTIVTVLPISVGFSMLPPVSLAVGGMTSVSATVTSDGTNKGVDWTVTCGSAGACGTFNPAHTASGFLTIYTAPTNVPAWNTVTLIATSSADPTKSASVTITILSAAAAAACGSGNEGLLNGQYAFLLQGFDASGAVAIAGSIDADGRGNVATLVGMEDIIRTTSGPQTNLIINPAGSSYSVGSDNRGCLSLATSAGTTTFRFALGAVSGGIASKGRMIEFDDATGTGTRVAGQIRLQNRASFSNVQFAGNYAFGMYGQDSAGGRFAMAGTVTSSGGGTITAGNFDSDDSSTLSNVPFTSGTYSVGSNGRGTLALVTGTTTLHFALYMISSSDALIVSTDALSNSTPIDSGEALGSPSSFSNSSLNGPLVLHSTGGSSGVSLVLTSADGAGNLPAVNIRQNNVGIFRTTTGSGTYAVAANGRVTLSGAGVGLHPPVLYLSGQNTGFLVGTGGTAESGMLEPQAAGTPSGAYFFGTEAPATRAVTQQSGVATLNAGNGSETEDSSGAGGLFIGNTSAFTYSFAANGTGNVGSNTTAVLISGSKLVFFDNTSTSATMIVIEK